ncbi:MAG: hypothetical protein ACYCUM_13875 [Solirubrobacteraceae bacterium]
MAATELNSQLAAATTPPGAASLARAWAGSYLALCALTLAIAAAALLVPDAPALARGLLDLKLSAHANPPPSIAGALSIALENTLHASWPLSLGPLGARARRATRTLADAAVAANLLVCALLVGGALAGYGPAVLAYLPHVPLEWAGIAIGAGAWRIERTRPLSGRERAASLIAIISILLLAAAVETSLTPHR